MPCSYYGACMREVERLQSGAHPILYPHRAGLRRLIIADLPLLHRWLNEAHVSPWWRGGRSSQREIAEKYIPRIEGRDPVEPYLILYEDSPIGYIQTYPISHDEEYAGLVGVEDAAGVDLFIGEAGYVHRGLGSRVLRRFLGEVVFENESVKTCVIGPEPNNTAAIRAYEKAGFRYFKTIQVQGEPEPEHLMQIGREEFAAGSVV